MDKETLLQQWKEIADSDLIFAEFSTKNKWPVSYEIVCFHCQQAAEKYLKWFLVLNDVDRLAAASSDEILQDDNFLRTNSSRTLELVSNEN